MRFSQLCNAFEKISETSKRLEKTVILADLIEKTPESDLPDVMLLIRGRVYPEWDKTTLGISEKLTIKALAQTSGHPETAIVQKFKELGDLGEVAEILMHKKSQATLFQQELTIQSVTRAIRKLPQLEGAGSVGQKLKYIAQVLSSASGLEAKFLIRVLLEDLRIGIAEGTVRDAIVHWGAKQDNLIYDPLSNTWSGDQGKLTAWQEAVQAALDRSNDTAKVVHIARNRGLQGLQKIDLTVGTPTKAMLAQRSVSLEDAAEKIGLPAAWEFKYDGFRLAIHKKGKEVTLFTRRLENVTAQFPDVVAEIKKINHDIILDSEAIGIDQKTGKHLPFQQISQRIRRKYNIKELAEELPVEINVFDILALDGKMVYQLPLTERRALLEKIVPIVKNKLRPSKQLVTADVRQAEVFYKQALDQSYEGLMVKKLDAPYRPGSRVGTWVKLKPTLDTIDVVITGAEWGEGKRSGWLTSFSVACQDEDGEYLDLGRVGTGFKELEQEQGVTFAEMTKLLEPHITHEEGKSVTTRPRLVIEIKFEEIQKSPSYGSGYALRFPRFVRVRDDRRASEITTLDEIEEMYSVQKGRV